MKRLIVASTLCLLCSAAIAQSVMKITFLKPEPVRIGGRECRTGDSFKATDKVKWVSDNQIIKVLDSSTGKIKVITPSLLEKSGKKTIWDYMISSNKLSTRSGKLLNSMELTQYFNRKIGILERMSVEAYLPVDDSRFYYVTYTYEGEKINKKLPVDGNSIVIDRSIFTIDGIRKEPFNAALQLYYYDASKGQSLPLAGDLMLNVISGKDCRNFIDKYMNEPIDTDTLREIVNDYLFLSNPETFFQAEDVELFITELML